MDSKSIRFLARMGSRGVLGQVLYDYACDGNDFFAISADLAHASGFDRIIKKFPEKFVDVGIAEQNLVGVAAGLAKTDIPVVASASAVTENELIGVTSRTLVEWETGGDGKYNYILQQGAFKKAAAGGYLKANRAYLHTAYNVTSPGAHDLEMVFDGEQGDVTGIKNLISTTSKGEGVAYNLAGQRVNASHKGIVIVNGKKYLNK